MAKAKDVEVIERDDVDQIVLPRGMGEPKAIEWLQRKLMQAEEIVSVKEVIEAGHFVDGLWAFTKALYAKYGGQASVEKATIETMFGPKKVPATVFGIEVGFGKTAQVPFGGIGLPNIEGDLQCGVDLKDGRFQFVLQGKVRYKDKAKVKELADLAREYASSHSLYRSQAVKLRFAPEGQIPGRHYGPGDYAPRFMDTNVDAKELVFPEEVQQMVDIHLKTPIEKTEACRLSKIPLKRGVLLEGPYGVGKTFLARVMAKLAAQNGWTFVYLDNVENLAEAIAFAREYQPAMIFAEDVDRAVADRDEVGQDILNTIDGIESKGAEVMVVLSTNHAERITTAMLRPGRLDAIISIKAPDARAAAQLLRNYSRGLLEDVPQEVLVAFSHRLAGQIPAVLREVVERAKLAAVRRQQPGEKLRVNMLDLHAAADSIDTHLALLNRPVVREESTVEWFARMLKSNISQAVVESLNIDEENGRQVHPLPRKMIEEHQREEN